MAKKSSSKAKPKRRKPPPQKVEAPESGGQPRCGLCGKTENLTQTECCGNWICDDEHNYRLFSYARNSCSRNHGRYTLCSSHFNEGHPGRWQDCALCRENIETEMYVWYGTNEYNFEKLQNPPKFKPTLCHDCGRRISLGEEGYMMSGKDYYCERCGAKHHPGLTR